MNEIAVVVLTAGRDDYLARTIESFEAMTAGNVTHRLMIDDSGSPDHLRELRVEYPSFKVHGGWKQLGQPAAIGMALTLLRDVSAPYVFWLEEDFTFDRAVDLDALTQLLHHSPHIWQAQLLRHAWFKGEVAAGGIIERDPEEYDRVDGPLGTRFEHRMWWTWNPAMFRREQIVHRQYPDSPRHEWDFGRQILNEDPIRRFAFVGDGSPCVTHIGERRA